MLETILWPVAVIGGLGLTFGLGLAFASKKLAVKTDPRVDEIIEILPGANCGGCGNAGCAAYAAALVEGKAKPGSCPVCTADATEKIAKILGMEAEQGERMVATVCCAGTIGISKRKYEYSGVQDCYAASLLADGPKACRYGCLGLGTCVKACPFDAIKINEGGVAEVDAEKCKACGKCVEACPKNVIRMVPYSRYVTVKCRALEKGRAVRENCSIGCIGCGMCVRNCKFGAITLENNLPVIDYDKCRHCMVCVEKCPTHAFSGDIVRRGKAVLEGDCIGCGICKTNCPFEAIEGEKRERHIIDSDKCKGCGICAEKCPKKAIVIK